MQRPRALGTLGLGFAAIGAVTAILLAIVGPHGLSGGYIAATMVTIAFRAAVIVGGLSAGVALLLDRPWAVPVMLAAAAFYLGYAGGYFISQGLGLWYPTG